MVLLVLLRPVSLSSGSGSDEVVEQAAGGVSVKQIFDENGEEAFRSLEVGLLVVQHEQLL